MTPIDLAKAIGDAKDLDIQNAHTPVKPRRAFKPWLLAAAIILTAILVGCTAVYLLRAKDIQMGEQTETWALCDHKGNPLGTTEVQEVFFTLNGLEGTPEYQASKEWFDFCQHYDTDHKIRYAFDAAMEEDFEKASGTIPEPYLSYHVYSQEMVEKINEIVKKYDLKLTPPVETVGYIGKSSIEFADMMTKITGIDSFFGPELRLNRKRGGIIKVSENGELAMDCTVQRPPELPDFALRIQYLPTGYFSTDLFSMTQEDHWTEWNYTTASGDQVLILHAGDGLYSWILCFREDGTVAVRIESRLDFYSDDEYGNDCTTHITLSKEQMETIADTINFRIQPDPDVELCHSEGVRTERVFQEVIAEKKRRAQEAASQNGNG